MPESQYRARQVGAKTHEVVEYDRDDSLPGKPLHILIPGGLIALASLAVIVFVIYHDVVRISPGSNYWHHPAGHIGSVLYRWGISVQLWI